MAKGDIKLSREHGVNPTIPICFWCGEEKGEIVLMGHIGDYRKGEDFKAPKHMVIDYEPCDKCKAEWEQGVAILEVSHTPMQEGQPPIAEGAYPTGKMVVVREEALNGDFPKGSKALMIDEEFRATFTL